MRAGSGALAAALLLAACRPAGPPPAAPIETVPAAEPVVRVGIAVDTSAVAITSAAPFEIAVPPAGETVAAAADEVWTFRSDSAGRIVGRSDAGRSFGPVLAAVRIRILQPGTPIMIAGRPYRGDALLRTPRPGRITAVNTLELESYLLGVVPLEIGVRPVEEIEAVKAQAVAARTYAIGHLGSRETLGFDFFATVADQVYGGVSREDPIVSEAVRETRGEIVTYAGRPIMAYYHSTCGGRTAAIDEVWNRPAQPYLVSVSDEVEGAKGRYYCESSNRFRWTVEWSGEELRRILSQSLNGRAGNGESPLERVQQLETTGYTRSGRAEALRIVADGTTYRVDGDSIRWVLRPDGGNGLNSTLFVLDVDEDGGEVRSARAQGGGWGHGIGMCQVGAIGRARAGQSYRRILGTYYRNTEIVRLY